MDKRMVEKLYRAAFGVTGRFKPSRACETGGVGAALLTKKGNIYTGVCIDLASSIGFCAERAAAAQMLKNRESVIKMVVAVDLKGRILPPCGVCREFMLEMNKKNKKTKVALGKNKVIELEKLMPHPWNG